MLFCVVAYSSKILVVYSVNRMLHSIIKVFEMLAAYLRNVLNTNTFLFVHMMQ
jgi:hypothetical protein